MLRAPFRALPSRFGPGMEQVLGEHMLVQARAKGRKLPEPGVTQQAESEKNRARVRDLHRLGLSSDAIAEQVGISRDATTWHLRCLGVSVLAEKQSRRAERVRVEAEKLLKSGGVMTIPALVARGWTVHFARQVRDAARYMQVAAE